MGRLRWSAPRREDDADWAALLAAIEAVDHRGEIYEVADLADEWASVWAHPATDSVFVWDRHELVAFGWLKTQVGQVKEHRIACWGGVRPSHRGRGLGGALLGWQLDRAAAIAGDLDPALATQINLDVLDGQADLRALADRAGFAPARRFLEVARPTSLELTPSAVPDGLTLVEWSAELDAAARAAHADSFVDHWGSEPRNEEEWRQWYTGHRHFRADLSTVVVEPTTGEVVAFVLCAAYPQDWETTPVEAWIHTVGTRRAWRGRGAARAALTEALARIASSPTGFEQAILGVDAANPTGALQLYRSLGFADVRAVTVMTRNPG